VVRFTRWSVFLLGAPLEASFTKDVQAEECGAIHFRPPYLGAARDLECRSRRRDVT
jgi:hypothetical protein